MQAMDGRHTNGATFTVPIDKILSFKNAPGMGLNRFMFKKINENQNIKEK